VLHFHGNGELVSDYVPGFADALAELGWNAAFGEFRGYGGSTGETTIPGILDDADAVLGALGVGPEKVVAFGRSVGSFSALELAKRHPDLAGLVLESAIADVMERILMRVRPEDLGATQEELDAEVARLVDHQAKLAGYRGPLLVLHTEHDTMVDATHAERLFEWSAAEEDDKRLVLLPEGDHNTILHANADVYWDELASFLSRF
jgi:hypothetical protein